MFITLVGFATIFFCSCEGIRQSTMKTFLKRDSVYCELDGNMFKKGKRQAASITSIW